MRTPSLPVFVLLFATAAAPAFAQPPDGVTIDPATHAWFENLVRADGGHCCGAADCRPAQPGEMRSTAGGLQVKIDDAWVDVPDYMVVHRDYSPIGDSVICKTHYDPADDMANSLYCVVPVTGM